MYKKEGRYMRAKLNAHYHWVIAAMAVLAMLVCGGVGNSLNGITLIPITQSLGVSRGEFSDRKSVV